MTVTERQVFTVGELQAILGIGRSTAYNLVKNKEVPTVRVGSRVLIPKNKFYEWLDERAANEK